MTTQFSAITNPLASVDGTWTPTLVTDATVLSTDASGYYHRTGKLVFFMGTIAVDSKSSGTTESIRIGGLPFTPANGTRYDGLGFISCNLWLTSIVSSSTNFINVAIAVTGSAAEMRVFLLNGTTGASNELDYSHIVSGTIFHFSGWYIASI